MAQKKAHLREDVLEANNYAAQVMRDFKLDLLDLHYYFHKQTARRKKDGIHWDSTSHRRITNLILNHLCESWHIETPGRIKIKNDSSLIDLGANKESDNDEEWADFNENYNETDTNDYDDDYFTNDNENDYNNNINYGLGNDNNFDENVNYGLENSELKINNANIQSYYPNLFPMQNQDSRNKLTTNSNFNINTNGNNELFCGTFRFNSVMPGFNQPIFNGQNVMSLIPQQQHISSILGVPPQHITSILGAFQQYNNQSEPNRKRTLNSTDSNDQSNENANQNKKRRNINF